MVGGILLTGIVGSGATLAGVRMHGLVFNVFNFEIGFGWISVSAHWRSVVRVVVLMAAVMASSGAARWAIRSA